MAAPGSSSRARRRTTGDLTAVGDRRVGVAARTCRAVAGDRSLYRRDAGRRVDAACTVERKDDVERREHRYPERRPGGVPCVVRRGARDDGRPDRERAPRRGRAGERRVIVDVVDRRHVVGTTAPAAVGREDSDVPERDDRRRNDVDERERRPRRSRVRIRNTHQPARDEDVAIGKGRCRVPPSRRSCMSAVGTKAPLPGS